MTDGSKLVKTEGILFIIFGIIAIIVPVAATIAIDLIIGWLFLISGIIQAALSFQKMKTGGFILSFLSAALSVVVGTLLVANPFHGAVALTMLLAIFFVVEGVIEIALGLEFRGRQNWIWLIASGIIALVLAYIIFSGLPGSAAWAIGTLVGINMLFFGFALISVSKAIGGMRP